MGLGNQKALEKTISNVIEKFNGRLTEIIYGNLSAFEEDYNTVELYAKEVLEKTAVTMKVIHYPINYIYDNGFNKILNSLASYAHNDYVLYLNVAEYIEGDIKLELLDQNYNCFMFDHATETHRWIRFYKKSELEWSGPIHEEIVGNKRTCPTVIFRMADSDKDMQDHFKYWVYNHVKEMTYFNQYIRIVNANGDKSIIGATNHGWIDYARRDYKYLVERLEKKGSILDAFKSGNPDLFAKVCAEQYSEIDDDFKNNRLINFKTIL